MIKFLITVAVIYAGLMAVLFVFQRRMIYHPSPTRPVPVQYGVGDMSPVKLATADGLEILAWWKPPSRDAAPVMVYFHGNGGHIGYRGPKIRPYLDAGWGILLPSWRGYGGNPGRPTEQGLYADGRAALRYLERRGIRADRIVLYGESLGSGVAVQMALEQPAGALVLEAPFTSITDMARRQFPFVPARLLVRDRFDSVSKIGRISLPVMIFHGEADAVVPVSLGRRLFETANEPKSAYFVPGAGHENLYAHGAVRLVREFVEKHLSVVKSTFYIN